MCGYVPLASAHLTGSEVSQRLGSVSGRSGGPPRHLSGRFRGGWGRGEGQLGSNLHIGSFADTEGLRRSILAGDL